VKVTNNERMEIIGDGSITNVLLVKNSASNLLSIQECDW
jgi:hypothetical protein